jgi:hypothetical protein
MSKIDWMTATALRDNALDAVSGSITGERGCIPPFSTLDPRFPDWVKQYNPWLDPLSPQRRIIR